MLREVAHRRPMNRHLMARCLLVAPRSPPGATALLPEGLLRLEPRDVVERRRRPETDRTAIHRPHEPVPAGAGL